METTKLSEKGQIVIPKRVRAVHGWRAGLEFSVQDSEEGLTLRPIGPFPKTTVDDVLGCVEYSGPAKSLEDMEAAIARGARGG